MSTSRKILPGTLVFLREHRSGKVNTGSTHVFLKRAKLDDFGRAYGQQGLVCTTHHGEGAFVQERGIGDLVPVVREGPHAKIKIPAACKIALREYLSRHG